MRISILPILILICSICFSQDYQVGVSYFHDNDYIEYIHGNLPIIISVPHGGEKNPSSIPDRNCDTCIVANDAFTQELSRLLVEKIHDKTSCYPYVIINRLHRRKLDANREISEAAQGNLEAENAWNFYQNSIETSKTLVQSNFTKGLFIDLHGHAHNVQRLELGYLITKIELMLSDLELNESSLKQNSSIRELSENNLNNLNFSDLLRGESSLGSMITNLGFPVVPSSDDPYPQENESYFSGGFNTMRHGSDIEGSIDAIQIECNQDVRFDELTRTEFAEALSQSLILFLETHYFESISTEDCGLVNTQILPRSEFKIFPNPFTTFFEIQLLHPIDQIIIFNSLGNVIYRSENIDNLEKMNFAKYPDGIYLIIGQRNNENIFSQKIIKTS